VSGLLEDFLRSEDRGSDYCKNNTVRHLFCSPISIVPTHHNPDQSSGGVVPWMLADTNFKHTPVFYPALPSSLDPSTFSSMERDYPVKSYSQPPVKVTKAEWGRSTDRCLFRAESRWLGHGVQRNQMLRPLCHASLMLIRSFLFYQFLCWSSARWRKHHGIH
jgi:hypothetical protein